MRNFLAVKDERGSNIPKEVYGWRIYLLAFSAAWASAMYGYDSAFIGGTLGLPAFKRKFGLDTAPSSQLTDLSSNIVSTFQGGAFFGCIFGFFLSEKFGRKWIIWSSGLVFCLGVALQMIGKLGLLYAGRVFTGLGVGASSNLIPIYISECSPALIRGRLIGIFEIMLQVALVIGFWVNYGVSENISPVGDKQWHIPIAIQFVPAGLLLLSMPFMIESPRWLVSKNRSSEALKNLAWVRNLPEEHDYLKKELQEIEIAVNHELEHTGGKRSHRQIFREMIQKGVRNRVLIGMALMLLQNLQGINALNYYSPTILKSIGFTGTNVGLLATGVYGLVKMMTTVIFMFFFVDKTGRRSSLLVGALGAGVAMFYLGIYTKLSGSFDHAVKQDGGARGAFAMIYVFAVFYGFSWNGCPWIISAEIMPNRVRTLGNMCVVCMQWLGQFIVVYSVPYMMANIKYGTFLFFGAFTVVAFTFALLFVPETRGIVLEDMDLLFGPDAPILAMRARKAYEDAHAAGLTANAVEEYAQKGDTVRVENV